MGRGKRWTEAENGLLVEMVNQGLSSKEIYQSGKLPDRTQDGIREQIKRLGSIVQTNKKFFVQTIERAEDIVSLEEVLKRFSTSFKQICEAKEVDKLELERYRMIFGAAKDYAPLLAQYERFDKVEEEINDLRKMVEEIKTQIHASTGSDKN